MVAVAVGRIGDSACALPSLHSQRLLDFLTTQTAFGTRLGGATRHTINEDGLIVEEELQCLLVVRLDGHFHRGHACTTVAGCSITDAGRGGSEGACAQVGLLAGGQGQNFREVVEFPTSKN